MANAKILVVDNEKEIIEPEPTHPRYVVTVPGLGYRLDGAQAA